jgi:hypothetical protein
MEMNVKKSKVVRISRQPSPIQNMINQTQLENKEYFTYLGGMITKEAGCHIKLNPRLQWQKQC